MEVVAGVGNVEGHFLNKELEVVVFVVLGVGNVDGHVIKKEL